MSNIQTNSWLMDRRTALRGLGSFIALPMLNSMVAAKAKPEIFGISLAPAAVLEGFSVFALVFALVLSGSIPA